MLLQVVHLMLQPHAGLVGNVVRGIPLRKGKGVRVGRTVGKVLGAGKGFGSGHMNSKKKKGKDVSNENNGIVGNGLEDVGVKEKEDGDDEDPHEVLRIVDLLPERARIQLGGHERLQELIEVVMDLGRMPLGRFPGVGDIILSDLPITMEDLKEVEKKVCEFGGDNRAGIEGTLHRISCIRNRDGEIVGVTCRVGRDIGNSADLISDIVLSGKSILLMGQPGIGKTTILRGICRILADICEKRVVIVDTSNEIGGDGDIPHSGIGRSRRMQVPLPENQCQVMIEAVENHMPEVIVIDEIGTEMECQAARTIAQRGVQLIATAHGTELANVMKNPSLQDLIGGITSVTLGDDEARRRRVQKSVLEREGPPVFDVAVEIIDRNTWRIHHNLSEAVDAILSGCVGQGETRTHNDSDGSDSKQKRPLPPTLPVLPDIKLGPLSNAARKAVSEIETITRETASSAVPLHQNSLAGPVVPGPQTKQQTKENSSYADGSASTAGASKRVPAVEETEGECVAREWFAMGGLHEGDDVVLTLFTFGVDIKLLWEVVDAMELATKVAVTPYLKDADAILGTRTSLKITGWVRKASRTSGIPLFPIKNCSASQLVRALHSLLGLQPSNTPVASEPNPEIEISAEMAKGMYAEETAVPTSLREDERAALAEIRYVIEDIVIPRCQSCDLLPRLPNVIEMQIKEIHNYGLECITVGSGNTLHLRILPSGSDTKNNDSLEGALA